MSGRENDPTDLEFQTLNAEFRRLVRVKQEYESLGSRLSGLSEYGLANAAWRTAAEFHTRATAVRQDLDQRRRDHTALRRAGNTGVYGEKTSDYR